MAACYFRLALGTCPDASSTCASSSISSTCVAAELWCRVVVCIWRGPWLPHVLIATTQAAALVYRVLGHARAGWWAAGLHICMCAGDCSDAARRHNTSVALLVVVVCVRAWLVWRRRRSCNVRGSVQAMPMYANLYRAGRGLKDAH